MMNKLEINRIKVPYEDAPAIAGRGKIKEIFCDRYICDFAGHEICPGNVIAVSKVSEKALVAHIVTGISKDRIYFAGEYHWREIKRDKNNESIKKEFSTSLGTFYSKPIYEHYYSVYLDASYSILRKNILQDHISIVANPLYAVTNPQMKSIIELSDQLKEDGLLPADYKLGRTLAEFKKED